MSFLARLILRLRFHRDLARSRRAAPAHGRRENFYQRHKTLGGGDD